MKLYRIGSRRHALFDGTGAFLYGGRWNSPGRRIIYAAQSLSGARLELLVHLPSGDVPADHAWIEIEVPADIRIETLDEAACPDWHAQDYAATQAIGDGWYDGGASLLLSVPSVPAYAERNILINQAHRDFARLTASNPQPLIWDSRLFSR